ncbi:MAG: hypothetical protein L3J53_01960 [Proteobacteria bacterium]|nr:hypothetical protein [Pseudomonadota bacterium]
MKYFASNQSFPRYDSFLGQALHSRLLSKNRELRRDNAFDLSNLNEAVEFSPLQDIQTQEIKNICDKTWVQLKTTHANKVLPE